MPMIQRRSDSQRKIRILSRPALEVPAPMPSRSPEAAPPEARFVAPGKVDVLVRFQPQAFDNLLAYCAESNVHGREICGLLLGKASRAAKNHGEKYILIVTDILPLETSDASGAHVSAAAEAWLQAEAQIEEHFQGKERLGWYHTHPTQGIFFSGSDKDFHSLFTKPFQFALVVDPRFPEVGLFHWEDRQAGQIAGPIPLNLKTEPARLSFPRPTLADSHRLLFLVLGLAGFVALLETGQDTRRLLPLAALFISALLLRFWNAGAVPGLPSQTRELRVGPAAGILLLAALLLPFFVAGLRLGTPLQARLAALVQKPDASPPAHTPKVQQAKVTPPPGVPTRVDTAQPPKAEEASPSIEIRAASPLSPLRREVTVWDRTSQVAFMWPDQKRVDYIPDGEGSYTVDKDQEAAFLSYLLNVRALDYQAYRQLQNAVGIDPPDGSWGPNSRRILVQRALECARSACEIKMISSTRALSIVFKNR